MIEWKEIRKKNKCIEKAGIIGIFGCFVIGIICDLNVLKFSNVFIQIEDISGFSLTILQVQATVGTLIFTIIALITGNISDLYMGVSISDYYLNIKPWKLNQKVLIAISLGLCLAGVIFHALNLYNVVFYLFVATLIVIALSIRGIYSAFRGKNIQNNEIEAYLVFMLENEKDYEKKLNLYQNFVVVWEEEINLQDKQNYEKYLSIFIKGACELWKCCKKEGLKDIQQQCYIMSYALLWSEKNTVKERGLEFIQDVYDMLWGLIRTCITDEIPLLNQYEKEFSLFAEINNELLQNMNELSIENVEKRLRFGQLADLIQRVAVWFRYDEAVACENEDTNDIKYKRYRYDYSSEISEINSFAKYIGYYLGKQRDKNNTVNQRIWADVLSSSFIFSSYNIPEERKEDFLTIKMNTYFCYCYGMIVNRQENIVKQGLYLNGMKQIIKLDNKYQALLYIAVHCYVYYLAVREDDDCVPEDVRRSARSIWNDKAVKDAFLEFINMLSETPQWLDLKAFEQIHKIVDKFELFPQYESFKTMIIEHVVSDFYLFLVLFMSHEFYLPELLERNIDDMSAFMYVSNGNEQKTKKMIKELFKMVFVGNKTDEKIDVEVDLMYGELEKIVKKKQKKRCIELAKMAQENYEINMNEEEICEKIKKDTAKSIKEKFASILTESDQKNGIISIKLLTLTNNTDLMGEKNSMDGYYSHIDGMFLYGIASFLYKRKVIEIKKRFDDFADDKEFMKYLETNSLHILLGSKYVFKNTDYRLNDEYKQFLEDYETIYTAIYQDAIALKRDSVRVCLHNINVSIHSPSIKETRVEYDQESKKYKYPIISGLPIDFEKEELRDFLCNQHKVIDITAKVSIQVNEKPCGTIFYRKYPKNCRK